MSPCKEVRAASAKSSSKLSEFEVECGMRADVYQSLLSFSKTINLDDYSSQDQRGLYFYLELIYNIFENIFRIVYESIVLNNNF